MESQRLVVGLRVFRIILLTSRAGSLLLLELQFDPNLPEVSLVDFVGAMFLCWVAL